MSVKQSLCYPTLKWPVDQLGRLFRDAADIGFHAVEMWGPPENLEQLVAFASECRLTVASMVGHKSLGQGLNDPANHSRIADELTASIETAGRLGIGGLICFAGNRRQGVGDDEAIDVIAEGFSKVAPAAEQAGVNLNMELLNSKIDHAGYQSDRTEFGIRVCRKVGSPRVKLLYDIYHMQIMEGDVIRTIRENIGHIGHFHTAGVPGRGNLDDTQELNYRAICRAISESGYDRYVGHEFKPSGDTMESLREAFETCDV
ncbi:MAG: hydroxypyruvate isomerase family protein [Phycisphaerae bacterium]